MKQILSLLFLLSSTIVYADSYDIVVYGGTSAAVTAAVQAKKMDKSVIIVSPDKHLGGLSSSGLGFTDSGNTSTVGGLSREFYQRIYAEYQKEDVWRWQKMDEYSNVGQGTKAMLHDDKTMWIFEPHVAERAFDNWVEEYKIPVVREAFLDREKGVEKKDGKILSITTLDGKKYAGKMFIDATYEGDLLASAGVSYHVGREGSEIYGEKWNGNQVGVLHHKHWFLQNVDPYKNGKLLNYVSADPPGVKGESDKRIQAYCFRMCLTKHDANRVPFAKPDNYDPSNYELLARVLAAGWNEVFEKFDPIPNLKTDTNNHGPFSTDFIGMNYDYPEASYKRRAEIVQAHRDYQQGLMYFLANDEKVPAKIRKQMSEWGLAKDEFLDNGNWPHQIYVREARRMIGEYVTTEHDCLQTKSETMKNNVARGSIGMGSYTLDSHNVRRYVKEDGFVQNEGDIGVHPKGPYRIDFGSILPKKSECTNLTVPVCLSSSHIAFGSIRMEPVFMLLAQSAATAAAMAIDAEIPVQDLEYAELAKRLLADGQRLEPSQKSVSGIPVADIEGHVIDDENAVIKGDWEHSTSIQGYIGSGYLHDSNADKGTKSAEFVFDLEKPGKYEVRVCYSQGGNRATNVPVSVKTNGGAVIKTLNQREKPALANSMHSLGIFEFGKKATVTISNEGTDGHVIVDTVSLISQ